MLNKFARLLLVFTIIVTAVSCSNKDQENLVDGSAPDVIFGDEQRDKKNLKFEDFLQNAQNLYLSRNFNELENYIKEYQDQFNSSKNQKELHLIKAMSLIGAKKLKEAKDLLTPLSNDQDPTIKGKSLFYLGDCLRLNKDYNGALKYYQSAYDVLKKPEILSSMGDTYVSLKNFAKAKTYYQRVLNENPESFEDRLYLATILFDEGNLKKAHNEFETILKQNPKSQRSYHYLALIAQKQNDNENYYYYLSREKLLARLYKEVVDLLKNQASTFKDIRLFKILISSEIRTGDVQGAINSYQKGVKLNKAFNDDVDIKVYHGILIVNKQQGMKNAVDYFAGLYKSYPTNFNVIVSYADILERYDNSSKNMKKVVDLYYKALNIEPSNREYRYKLANYYETHNQSLDAQVHFAILFYYQQEYDRALEAFLFLEKDGTLTPDTAFYIAKIYEQLEDNKSAIKYYKKAIKLGAKKDAKDALKKLES